MRPNPAPMHKRFAANACATPTALTYSGATTSSITLAWNGSGALYYNIRYKRVGITITTWITTTSTTNTKTITGLVAGSQYQWQVQAVCIQNGTSASAISNWSAISYFATPLVMPPFPNPVQNRCSMNIDNEDEVKIVILISDKMGTVVKQINKTVLAGGEELQFDVADLKDGIYFIQIKGENINEVQRMIIMR